MVISMKMRITQPSDNKYYIRKANGGYNGAVKGKPTIKDANVLCNCVGYLGVFVWFAKKMFDSL